MLLFTVPERKTNCTQNKNWALQDVVTVWQKPTYWLPTKPDQGDLTQKGCLFFFLGNLINTTAWVSYSRWSGCDIPTTIYSIV